MSQIAIINSSTVVSDTDGQIIVNALNVLLPQFCKDWSLTPCLATYIAKGKTSTIPLKVLLLDSSDVQGALGYHGLSSDIPYGKCFAKTILQSGGVLLYSTNYRIQTFAQVVSHEVFELLMDPYCNLWWDIGDGKKLIAAETGDPVQGNIVPVTLTIPPKSALTYSVTTGKFVTANPTTVIVGMSDWILPAWSDPQRKTGPYNHLNTLKGPFSLSPGGYAIKMTGGAQGYVLGMSYGEKVTDKEKELYEAKSRIRNRTKKTT